MPRVVDAPSQLPTRAGSLRNTAVERDGERLIDGIAFRPESCAAGHIIELCPPEPVTKTITAPSGTVTVDTVGLWVGDECSAMTPGAIGETIARAERRLDIVTSHMIEEYLWDGIDTPATGEATLASTAATDLSVSPVSPVRAFALLVQAVDSVLQGARGVIHTPRWTVPYLANLDIISRRENVIQVTGTDHVVITGSGYSGNDPDGNAPADNEAWLYATGSVEYALSNFITPGREDPAALVDRSVNTVEVRAERGAAAWFDPCAHFAISTCFPAEDCETS